MVQEQRKLRGNEVTGVKDFDALVEEVENLPTLYSVDMVNMDTCKNQLLLEDIRQYGRKI